jgi:hypothetical protein
LQPGKGEETIEEREYDEKGNEGGIRELWREGCIEGNSKCGNQEGPNNVKQQLGK